MKNNLNKQLTIKRNDDEIQLLLMAALDFKSQCESEEWTRSPKDLFMNKYFNDEAI